MKRKPFRNETLLAEAMLRNKGINPIDAAEFIIRIIADCKEKNFKDFPRIKEIIRLGTEAVNESQKSITFSQAVELTIADKKHRRPRTLNEINTMMRKLMKVNPELGKRKVRNIKTQDCRRYLKHAFQTPRQFAKARLILSGVFSIAVKHGFATNNPVITVEKPVIREGEIRALSLTEIQTLLDVAECAKHSACLPTMALMLYAGIRPQEVTRMTWGDIALEDKVVVIRAQHSKTGGARHVTIRKPLERILRQYMPKDLSLKIAPQNWTRRWKELRHDAGWNMRRGKHWQQDCLRHTFATYYIKTFRNLHELQLEMGHRSAELLRTRYINLNDISGDNSLRFWGGAA